MGTVTSQSTSQSKIVNSPKVELNQGSIKADEMREALKVWGNGLVAISNAHANGGDVKSVAEEKIKNSYNYLDGQVLLKPTLASNVYFRPTFEGALSYFIGSNSTFTEDLGFALNPWVSVDFALSGFIEGQDQGLVMGNKLLKKADGSIVVANFSMGFTRASSGELKINLHHSSVPFSPS